MILGLGNVLCSDDGAGVAAVHRLLAGWEPPSGVRILDGGTLGLALLPYIEEAKAAILVDAVRADEPPGTLLRLEGDDVGPAVAGRLSVHQIGVADLLDAALLLGKSPPSLVLLGVVPEHLEVGLGLSPSVEERLPALVRAVIEEAGRLGYELEPRDQPVRTGALFR